MKRILIVLGNENAPDGDPPSLMADAIARCERAIELLKIDEELLVLPTGSFGPEFNRSTVAHGQLLTDRLAQHVTRDRILPYTNSSNTLEDAFAARRICMGQHKDVRDLIVVTSDYHIARAEYIFRRVFPEFVLVFDGVASGNPEKAFEEAKKLERIKKEWVDVPLYGSFENSNAGILSEIYEAAGNTHAHYDNISLALFSGMVAIFFFPHAAELTSAFAFFMSAVLIGIIILLYRRIAKTAHVARTVQQLMEFQFHSGGFSASIYRQWWIRQGPWTLLTMRGLVTASGIILIAMQLGFAGIKLFSGITGNVSSIQDFLRAVSSLVPS